MALGEDADWSDSPSSMLFKISHLSPQWFSASASPSPSTIIHRSAEFDEATSVFKDNILTSRCKDVISFCVYVVGGSIYAEDSAESCCGEGLRERTNRTAEECRV